MSEKANDRYKDMMLHFVEEVSRGVSPEKAGWRELKEDEPEVELIQERLVEQVGRKVRIASSCLQSPLRIDEEGIVLREICLDIFKAAQVEKDLTQVLKSQDFELLAGVTMLGWWRMLRTSELPVIPDRVLKEGISVVEWYVEAPKAAFYLARSVAISRLEVDPEACLRKIWEFSPPALETTPIFSKIEKVLCWEIVVENLPESLVDALSFLWFADHLCSLGHLCYPEAQTYLQSRTWDLTVLRTKKPEQEIVEQLDSVHEVLSERIPGVEWRGIICFPW